MTKGPSLYGRKTRIRATCIAREGGIASGGRRAPVRFWGSDLETGRNDAREQVVKRGVVKRFASSLEDPLRSLYPRTLAHNQTSKDRSRCASRSAGPGTNQGDAATLPLGRKDPIQRCLRPAGARPPPSLLCRGQIVSRRAQLVIVPLLSSFPSGAAHRPLTIRARLRPIGPLSNIAVSQTWPKLSALVKFSPIQAAKLDHSVDIAPKLAMCGRSLTKLGQKC